MKRATREWLNDVCYVGDGVADCAADALDSHSRQRAKLRKQAAEIRDLKARLAVCRVLMLELGEQGLAADDVDWSCIRATDLKNKKWRKP